MRDDAQNRRLALFRQWIKVITNDTGLSKSALAERAELSASTINRPMRNDVAPPKWQTIVAIAKAVGVEPPPGLNPDLPSSESPATVDAQHDDSHDVRRHTNKDEGDGMSRTDIEILRQLAADYGVGEIVRQLRGLEGDAPGRGEKKGMSA